MKLILATILPTILGLTIMINGQFIKTDDIIASAWMAHHQVNTHEVRTALELYYLNNGNYPNVNTSSELFEILYDKEYISGIPPKPESYTYENIPEKDSYKFYIN